MADFIKFPLRDGTAVLVEVESASTTPVTRGGRPAETVTEASETLEAVTGRIVPLVGDMLERLRSMAGTDGEVEIEFGLRISSSASLVVARAGGEANFRVQVRSGGRSENA